MSLLQVRTVEISRSVVESGYQHLRAVGSEGNEGFVLWAGHQDGDVFGVVEAVIPEQQGLVHEGGVCVIVGSDELHRLNVTLHKRGLTLVAQIHSHPSDAYHSTTDDAFPIVARAGGLSIVVPDFAVRPFSLSDCAVYRLSREGIWEHLSMAKTLRLIRISE